MEFDKLKKNILNKTVYRFLIVGGGCTFIDFAIYFSILNQLGPFCSKGISMSVSTVVNFILNKFWSFSAGKNREFMEGVRYVCTQVINISFNIMVNAFVLYITGEKIIAFIFATGMAMIVNYMLQRFWVFKRAVER